MEEKAERILWFGLELEIYKYELMIFKKLYFLVLSAEVTI